MRSRSLRALYPRAAALGCNLLVGGSVLCASCAHASADLEPHDLSQRSSGSSHSPSGASSYLEPRQVAKWHAEELVAELPDRWLQLRGPIGTVCVTGDDRIGKSTLLTLWGRTLLRDRPEGFSFSVGHKRTSHTQGMWSAVLFANATGLDYHVNLCDSQGLKQVSGLKESRLFSANVFIPTVLVYVLYTVVQNDQVRDLARMAKQFKAMPQSELKAYGRVLAPHLIVVVRDENEFVDEDGDEPQNLTAHLEEVLHGEDYAEDKALVRSVFQTREAWPLRRLSSEGLRAVRQGDATLHESAAPWQASGRNILQRVLTQFNARADNLPRDGLELASWYQSVTATVNDQDVLSFSRLVGHGERLASGRWQRRVFEEGGFVALAVLAGSALVLFISGAIGRWLDRIAWLAWVALWDCYVGMSPLVSTPLRGFVQVACDRFMGLEDTFSRAICKEASPRTVALLLATVIGAISYPLLTLQLRQMTRFLPADSPLQTWIVVLGLAGLFAALQFSYEVSWVVTSNAAVDWNLAALATLSGAAAMNALHLAKEVKRNSVRISASNEGLALHNRYVSSRFAEVQNLEASFHWRDHYKRHDRHDAVWRFRVPSLWWQRGMCFQNFGLLAWALLIRPHVDLLLAVGALANLARWLLWVVCGILRCKRNSFRGDDADAIVALWYDSLIEASSESDEDCAGHASSAGASAGSGEIPEKFLVDETEEERQLRFSIERMRLDQERQWLR